MCTYVCMYVYTHINTLHHMHLQKSMYDCGTFEFTIDHSLGSGTHILFSDPRTFKKDLSHLISGQAVSIFSWGIFQLVAGIATPLTAYSQLG